MVTKKSEGAGLIAAQITGTDPGVNASLAALLLTALHWDSPKISKGSVRAFADYCLLAPWFVLPFVL